MRRPLASMFLIVPLTLTLWGGGTPTQATAASTVTANFSGTLNQQGLDVYPFTVSQSGDVTATLNSVGPLATLAVGFGVGSYDSSTSTCSLLTEDDNARQGDVFGRRCPARELLRRGVRRRQRADLGDLHGAGGPSVSG